MSGHALGVVDLARSWIGTPYRHQGCVRGGGADCLGLLRGLWRDLYGAEPEPVPPYTADWAEAGGEEALWDAARRWLRPCRAGADCPGDVLLFRMRDDGIAKHLGIAAEVGAAPSFIHAYCGHGVVESPLSQPWARRIVARFTFPEGEV
ncbi:MAG: peptidase [Rhodobacter sp.]|nr:peptidase [Rhodobacter sp.]MCA3493710.1 peptidase [Rhodobacter sp.]MCA3500095.1 peptidase [Rhodobacter sp.]MCA3503784.1 peptidase [Rhodobacter sp.]MCA3517521.1 peptidase [Rhodobacter sp.]